MSEFSFRDFLNIYCKHPENLFQCSLDVLQQGIDYCHNAKVAALAELFVRVFLSGNQQSPEAEIINRELPDGELRSFISYFSGPSFSCEQLTRELWNSSNPLSQCCQAAVRKRFQLLFKAEGLIPVYRGNDAYFLPFHFADHGVPSGVYDLCAEEKREDVSAGRCRITEWSSYAEKLALPAGVVLHLTYTNQLRQIGFTGDSLLLPLQLAWWRRNGDLPKYNVFRFIATGTFDEKLRLASVSTKEKIDALACMREKLFICPESQDNSYHGQRGLLFLPVGIEKSAVLERVRREAERYSKLDLDYALHRIDGLSREVRLINYKNWKVLLERLENAKVFDKYDEAQEEYYLTIFILIAEACCHAGLTDKAMKYNEMARKYAEEHGDKYLSFLVRVLIDRMVLYQDLENFAEVLLYGQELRANLAKLNDNDLWMRYYGTMGQALAYGKLSGLSGIEVSQALTCFNKAAEYARKIGNIAEISHDLNYVHLYYSLFEPSSLEEEDAYNQAHIAYEKLLIQSEAEAEKSLYHLKRQQAMGWYRRLLSGDMDVVNSYSLDQEMRRTLDHAEDWQRALVGKYIGALEAAAGNKQNALEHFKSAEAAVNAEERPGVKTLIRITVCAEAYRSLGPESGMAFLDTAKRLLASFPADAQGASLLVWRNYCHNPQAARFPGLDYWY